MHLKLTLFGSLRKGPTHTPEVCAHGLCYEHAKAVHSTRAEPRSGPRQGAWYTFHKHWLATGVASMAKGGRPRLHLLTAAPPVSPATPGSTHLRVGVALTPAKGKRPTASAWALEAHDIGPGGAQPEFNQRSHCHLGCGF